MGEKMRVFFNITRFSINQGLTIFRQNGGDIMKKNLPLLLLFLPSIALYSQTDSSRLEFFPLHKGDIWQYYYGNTLGEGYLKNQTVVTMDTLMPNGFHYIMVTGSPYGNYTKFYRIDSLMRIQEYYNFFGDTCGGAMNEANTFRLAEKDSTVWQICYNIAQLTTAHGPYYFRYNGMDSAQNLMYFQAGAGRTGGDTSFQEINSFVLMRGLGFYSSDYGENQFTQLTGAIINGVKYGTIQDGVDEVKSQPYDFELSQNYPNPFNGETVIEYSISKRSFVRLSVFDLLGREILILVDRDLAPGRYEARVTSEQLASGVYFYRLLAGEKQQIRATIIQK